MSTVSPDGGRAGTTLANPPSRPRAAALPPTGQPGREFTPSRPARSARWCPALLPHRLAIVASSSWRRSSLASHPRAALWKYDYDDILPKPDPPAPPPSTSSLARRDGLGSVTPVRQDNRGSTTTWPARSAGPQKSIPRSPSRGARGTLIGTTFGAIPGYFGGRTDTTLMRSPTWCYHPAPSWLLRPSAAICRASVLLPSCSGSSRGPAWPV